MNSKNTWLWLVVAAGLFLVICLLNRHPWAAPSAASQGWPDFPFASATSVQVIPPNSLEIRVDRTNGNWFLSKPLTYPAQTAGIQALLDSLAKLKPVTRITASELRQQPTAEQDYGFDKPALSLVIEAPGQQWQLKVGRCTAPGDQVFLRVVGVDGAFVTDSAWLKYLPLKSVADWRETSLVNDSGSYDAIVLTNGAKIIELHLDSTNHLWRMTRPLQARADSDRINRALQQLRSARVAQFVTDDPQADLSAYELQPPSLNLWLGRAGSFTEGLHTGKTPTNEPTLVYAKREGWNGVIATLKEPMSPWHGSVNDFRNAHLLDLTTPINEVELRTADGSDHFILQRLGSNTWHVAGETFPVDTDGVQDFLKMLGNLKATNFVKDVVTAPDLQAYGLTKPALQITFRPVAGDTNQILTQLAFSVPQTNGVYVRRSDEDCIYALDPADLNRIPALGCEFRARRIWNVPEQDIASLTVHQNGQTRQILHNARNIWVMAPGSPGQVFGPNIEEAAHQLGDLTALGWVGHRITNPAVFGVTTNSLQVVLELKNGQKHALDFGAPILDQPLALVTLDGDRWAFVVPASLYQYVVSFLTISPNGS